MENPYLFVEGDPVNYADPSGLAPDCELTIEFHVIDGRVRAAVYCANVPGGRLPPTFIHPQDFSRADASTNFLSATGRGACGFCGGDGQAVFLLLGAAAQPTVSAANATVEALLLASQALPQTKLAGAAALGIAVTARRMMIEVHHLLPQAKRFSQYFKRAGLNINDYTIPLTRARHRLLPDGIHTKSGRDWNGVWDAFFRANSDPSRTQILNQLARMRRDFGI